MKTEFNTHGSQRKREVLFGSGLPKGPDVRHAKIDRRILFVIKWM